MPDVAVLDPNAPLQTSADTPPPNASAQTDWGKGWVKDGAFDHAALVVVPTPGALFVAGERQAFGLSRRLLIDRLDGFHELECAGNCLSYHG